VRRARVKPAEKSKRSEPLPEKRKKYEGTNSGGGKSKRRNEEKMAGENSHEGARLNKRKPDENGNQGPRFVGKKWEIRTVSQSAQTGSG